MRSRPIGRGVGLTRRSRVGAGRAGRFGHAGGCAAAHVAAELEDSAGAEALCAARDRLGGGSLLYGRSGHGVDVGLLGLVAVGGFVVVADIATPRAEPAQEPKRPEAVRSGSGAVGAGETVSHPYTLPVPLQATQLTVDVVPLLPICWLPVPLQAEQSTFLPCWPISSVPSSSPGAYAVSWRAGHDRAVT